jgi:hypothetical protein
MWDFLLKTGKWKIGVIESPLDRKHQQELITVTGKVSSSIAWEENVIR